MTPRRLPTAALLVAVALFGVAACSDSDSEGGSDEERQEYVDALVASAEEESGLDDEQTQCVAESFVDGYGAAELADADVTPEDMRDAGGPGELGLDFSDAQRDDFYERLTGCMDVRSLMLDAFTDGAEAPDEVRACLDDQLDDDLLRDFLVVGFTEGDAGFEDNPDLETDLNAVFEACSGLGSGDPSAGG